MIGRYRGLLYGCCFAWLMVQTAGCYKATFFRDPHVVRGEEHDQWTDFFLFGLAGKEEVDVRRYCPPDRVAEVRTGANVGTGVVSFLTLGTYTPRKIYVTCAAFVGPTPAPVGTTDSRAEDQKTEHRHAHMDKEESR
jgi:hypothetical protein